jgi:hypothetical protein
VYERVADHDNLRARKIYTQFRIVKKILIVTIMVVALAAVLLSFQKFRSLGCVRVARSLLILFVWGDVL